MHETIDNIPVERGYSYLLFNNLFLPIPRGALQTPEMRFDITHWGILVLS